MRASFQSRSVVKEGMVHGIPSLGKHQGFTREPQATVARDGTVSPAASGKILGSHCRGNGIPRSLFSAPVGTGINGSYASDAGWERDVNCYICWMGTAVVGFNIERELQTTWHGNGK